MDISIVVGADTSIGITICRKLIALGLRVYGIGTDFSKTIFVHKDFKAVICDYEADPQALVAAVQEICSQERSLGAVVYANLPSSKLWTAVDAEETQRLLNKHLVAPALLAQTVIAFLEKSEGYLLMMAPEGRSSNENALEHMYVSALRAFSEQLFSDVRDDGVKVTLITACNESPEDGSVNEFNNPESQLNPISIADTVERIIRYREGNVITHITVKPQRKRESGRTKVIAPDEYKTVQLPSEGNFPPEQELIPTPLRKKTVKPPVSMGGPPVRKKTTQKKGSTPGEKTSLPKSTRKQAPVPKKVKKKSTAAV